MKRWTGGSCQLMTKRTAVFVRPVLAAIMGNLTNLTGDRDRRDQERAALYGRCRKPGTGDPAVGFFPCLKRARRGKVLSQLFRRYLSVLLPAPPHCSTAGPDGCSLFFATSTGRADSLDAIKRGKARQGDWRGRFHRLAPYSVPRAGRLPCHRLRFEGSTLVCSGDRRCVLTPNAPPGLRGSASYHV